MFVQASRQRGQSQPTLASNQNNLKNLKKVEEIDQSNSRKKCEYFQWIWFAGVFTSSLAASGCKVNVYRLFHSLKWLNQSLKTGKKNSCSWDIDCYVLALVTSLAVYSALWNYLNFKIDFWLIKTVSIFGQNFGLFRSIFGFLVFQVKMFQFLGKKTCQTLICVNNLVLKVKIDQNWGFSAFSLETFIEDQNLQIWFLVKKSIFFFSF